MTNTTDNHSADNNTAGHNPVTTAFRMLGVRVVPPDALERGGALAVTHSGVWHLDEAMAVAILVEVARVAGVVRTRDPEVIQAARHRSAYTAVVDVGGVYDPSLSLFDHHQRGCQAVSPATGQRLSAAGMVWQAHGPQLVHQRHPQLDPADRAEVEARVQRGLLRPIDLTDTGEDRPAQKWAGASLWALLGAFEKTDAGFEAAIGFARWLLTARIAEVAAAVQAEAPLKAALAGQGTQPAVYIPWHPNWGAIVAATCPEARFACWHTPGGDVGVQQVVDRAGEDEAGFGQPRAQFPAAWKGLSGQAVRDAGAPDGVTFVHDGRFYAAVRDVAAAAAAVAATLGLEEAEGAQLRAQLQAAAAGVPR